MRKIIFLVSSLFLILLLYPFVKNAYESHRIDSIINKFEQDTKESAGINLNFMESVEYYKNNNEITVYLKKNFIELSPKEQFKILNKMTEKIKEQKQKSFRTFKNYKILDEGDYMRIKSKYLLINYMYISQDYEDEFKYYLRDHSIEITHNNDTETYRDNGKLLMSVSEHKYEKEKQEDSLRCYNGTRENSFARSICMQNFKEKYYNERGLEIVPQEKYGD